MKNIIILLLCILIVVVAIDILTGIWYWNRIHLIFDADNFNKLATPIAGFLGIIIYSTALFISLNQNKILKSQNIKPFIEKEIDDLRGKAEKIVFRTDTFDELSNEVFNCLNYIRSISKSLLALDKHVDYHSDLKEFENGKQFEDSYFENRSYYGIALFLSHFYISFPLSSQFFYSDIKTLVNEINDAKLIREDKEYLKKKVRKTFLGEYMALLKFMDEHSSVRFPPVPVLFKNLNYPQFVQLNKTNFREDYDWFRKRL